VVREGLLKVKKSTIAETTTTTKKPTDEALKTRTLLKNAKVAIAILQTCSKETI